MKKLFLLNGILITVLFSACSLQPRLYQQPAPPNVNGGPSSSVPLDDTGVGMGFVKDPEEGTEQIIEGAYVENIGCGYLSISPRPDRNTMYLVCDEQDIKVAEDVLGMKVPDNADWPWDFETGHVGAFQKMKEDYPIEDYNYIFMYEEHACLGYSSHADGVAYDNDRIYFHCDVVKRPAEGEAVCDAMDGEFKIAAVPKSAFDGKTFKNVVTPSSLVEYSPDPEDPIQ